MEWIDGEIVCMGEEPVLCHPISQLICRNQRGVSTVVGIVGGGCEDFGNRASVGICSADADTESRQLRYRPV